MEKVKIKEISMRECIIQSAKEILISEGLKCYSIKNVAEKVGCSYAIIHGYFSDANELLFLSIKEIQDECLIYVKEKTSECENKPESLKRGILAFLEYFAEYPGVFELLYLEKAGDLGNSKPILDLINGFAESYYEQEWPFYKDQREVNQGKIDLASRQMKYTIMGLLLFYLNRRVFPSYMDFMDEAKIQIDSMLNQLS